MTPFDLVASFAISVLAGYVPAIGKTDDVMKHLKKCYNKALGKWNVSQETRELMSDNMLDQLPKLQQYIKDKRKGINPKTKELLVAWLQEIHRDSKCLEYISSFQTDIINYKLDEYFEDLKKGFEKGTVTREDLERNASRIYRMCLKLNEAEKA